MTGGSDLPLAMVTEVYRRISLHAGGEAVPYDGWYRWSIQRVQDLSEQLRRRRAILDLQWLPREANTEADALTNLNFEGFTPGKRIEVNCTDIK